MTKLPSILLVDDDATTNFLNKLLLTNLNVAEQLLVAQNGAEALNTLATTCTAAATHCPALILLDVNMPVMNGIEFLEAYQRLPLAQRRAIVIVMLTTSMHLRDLERVQQLPVDGVLDKPLTREKVGQLLHRYFQQELPEA